MIFRTHFQHLQRKGLRNQSSTSIKSHQEYDFFLAISLYFFDFETVSLPFLFWTERDLISKFRFSIPCIFFEYFRNLKPPSHTKIFRRRSFAQSKKTVITSEELKTIFLMKIYLYICNHCIRLNNLVMKEYLIG